MKRNLLVLLFALLIPSSVFAANWQPIASQGAEPIYYDFDSVEKLGRLPHMLKVDVKRTLSIDEATYYAVKGQMPDAIVVTLYINTIERYFEPLNIKLIKDSPAEKLIAKIAAEEVFNDVRMSVVEPDVQIVPFAGNEVWAIEELLAEISLKFTYSE